MSLLQVASAGAAATTASAAAAVQIVHFTSFTIEFHSQFQKLYKNGYARALPIRRNVRLWGDRIVNDISKNLQM
tara:strand:- start:7750 stop:7971 length:222 start_codon:yes stop_codon:yes gene_type:complete